MKKNILIINNEERPLVLLKKRFEHKGDRAFFAFSIQEALEVVKKNFVDAIICDVDLSDISHESMMHKIDNVGFAPFILFLIHDDGKQKERVSRHSTYSVMTKPAEAQMIFDEVNAAFTRSNTLIDEHTPHEQKPKDFLSKFVDDKSGNSFYTETSLSTEKGIYLEFFKSSKKPKGGERGSLFLQDFFDENKYVEFKGEMHLEEDSGECKELFFSIDADYLDRWEEYNEHIGDAHKDIMDFFDALVA